MPKYAAFFRGLNVGGKNIVKMADLETLFSSLGFQEVKTYIQSGNVVFSSQQDEIALAAPITSAFETRFGFQSAVILRSDTELSDIIHSLPFSAAEIEIAEKETPDVEHLYVYLSDAALDREQVTRICADYDGKDTIYAANREIYLLCRQSVRNSKLAARLAKLPQALTARNLRTLEKISGML
ncbi:conserved hypothetical protein [uncultured Eubacteriales bacterium]|uniref:DUF1697 domain-containing protein n=1 Tax=uncultured Eubacteriales bacterium TaxID=172733 RepID=A0A212JQ60_9FIRM|nr:conserved hypothetical protein [uncultured Eubacteriales bacterium]